eukprot:m.118401 g.118401  ORF g.118401 m.118401 type:complete len:213 (-) comp12892_c2_seq7:1608-2246(-)
MTTTMTNFEESQMLRKNEDMFEISGFDDNDDGYEDDGFEIVDASDAVLDLNTMHLTKQKHAEGITKAHWKPPTAETNCETCHLKFDLIDKKHWCYRCGGLFCKKCVGYRRKLSPQAAPDPIHGMYFNVCIKCFKQAPHQSIGPTRNHTQFFQQLRNQSLLRRDEGIRNNSVALCRAYQQRGVSSTLSDTFGIDPEWTEFACLHVFVFLFTQK